MYQALYRKWRPRTFDDVVGQGHVTETLRRQLMAGRLSHAYLFVGTRGTGKTTCAKILARAVNCEHPADGNPCNKCPSCLGIESGAILDVEELDAASNNGVENIRSIREEAVFTPASVRKRVYIVDEVHMLSMSAFNALLKILEEPPEHLIFILATTELNKVPATILSRCQRFSFKRISAEDISGRLNTIASRENLDLAPDAAELLARLADGSMRDAISLLDQCSSERRIDTESVLRDIGLVGTLETERLLEAVAAGDADSALQIFEKLYADGKKLSSLLGELILLERDVLLSMVAPGGGKMLLSGSYGADTIVRFSKLFSAHRLVYGMDTMMAAQAELPRSADVRTTAELCILKLCDETLSDDVSALRARIARLEETLSRAGTAPAVTVPAADTGKTVPKPQPPVREDASPMPETSRDADAALAEPARQPEPVEEPPQEKQTVKAPQRPGLSGEQAWNEILSTAKSKLDIPVFMFLSDNVHSEGQVTEGKLTVRAKSVIALNMLNTTAVTSVLKGAAEAVLGHPVAVSVTEYGKDSKAEGDKLDSLMKFGNITFK